jgi:hypothetical protein
MDYTFSDFEETKPGLEYVSLDGKYTCYLAEDTWWLIENGKGIIGYAGLNVGPSMLIAMVLKGR